MHTLGIGAEPSRRGDPEDRARARSPLHGTGYRALRRIGVGAASEVFEAVGPLGELCAVKVLRPTLAHSHAAARFAQEARSLGSLDHPNLVRVIEAGRTSDGRGFLVMPRLLGETLRDRLRRAGPLPPPRACTLVAGALDGLETAHRAGIVHRDIKPANLFVARVPSGSGVRERLVVLDFGVAKVSASTLAPTTGAQIIGTPRYLAPEQILGGFVDGRVDVYAMGLVLFEALAGSGPFAAADYVGFMRAHVLEAPRLLADVAPAVPRALDAAIARALVKAPRRRWSSARAFADALRRCARST